jgi:hypothetical protein
VDIDHGQSLLCTAWGLKKTADFARKVAAQEPIWVRGSRTLPSIVTGELPMMMGTLLHSVKRAGLKIAQGACDISSLAGSSLPHFQQAILTRPGTDTRQFSGWNGWPVSVAKITDDQEPWIVASFPAAASSKNCAGKSSHG